MSKISDSGVKNVFDDWNTEDHPLEALKACPFCGGDGMLLDNSWEEPVIDKNGAYVDMNMGGGDVLWCRCSSCGAETADCNTPEEAIALWNQRRTKQRLKIYSSRIEMFIGGKIVGSYSGYSILTDEEVKKRQKIKHYDLENFLRLFPGWSKSRMTRKGLKAYIYGYGTIRTWNGVPDMYSKFTLKECDDMLFSEFKDLPSDRVLEYFKERCLMIPLGV